MPQQQVAARRNVLTASKCEMPHRGRPIACSSLRAPSRGRLIGVEMAALARTISRLFLNESTAFDILKQIALFLLASLLVTLLALTYGLDLSPGFF
jgi:hypothetical protein